MNRPAPQTLDLLLSRRSGSAKAMTGPGPNPDELRVILQAGARAPDHKKLFPWRFILFEGEGRKRMGDMLADVLATEGDVSDERIAMERGRFLRAPVVIGVVSRVRENIPIPTWEQELSAGAVCQNILLASHALGYVANWITEWCAYDPLVKQSLGLVPGERIAGFIYIGKPAEPLEERVRPDLDKLITRF
ncbi:MAG TPA: nitroreductase [Rhizomicrobium sp.]|nr:nitroreductase [Rhizomicrobium sp.]